MALGSIAKRLAEMGESTLKLENPPLNQPAHEDNSGKQEMMEEEDSDEEVYAIANFQQILQHNLALRNNFEELKQLHLQLTESNIQLHQACIRIHLEKESMEKASSESKIQIEAMEKKIGETKVQKEAIEKAFNDTKLQKELLQSSIENLNQKHEREKCQLIFERDEMIAKTQTLEHHVQNLDNKICAFRVKNEELVQQLEKTRLELDQVVADKENIEMVHSKHLKTLRVEEQTSKQEVLDLVQKCKHLEMDLEKSKATVEVVQQKLLGVTYEKDSIITNLKDSLQRLEEDMFAMQEHRKKIEQDWNCERKRLLHTIESKEWHDQQMLRSNEETEMRLKDDMEMRFTLLQREKEESERFYREEADLCIKEALMDVRYEEDRQRELRRTLQGEVADLRAMLSALEQASTDAETRHSKTIKELTKDCMSLRKEIAEYKEKEKENTEALKGLQRENSQLLSEIEGLRAQLDDALSKNHESYSAIVDYRRAIEEYERKTEHLKIDLHDLEKCRERDQQDHIRSLENAKRIWATEKIAVILKENKLAEERQRAITEKNQSLKKKLKETNKLLATITADHNQLMIRTREIETQLAYAYPSRMMCASHLSDSYMARSGRSSGNAAWLRAEMAQLEKRQSQFLLRGEHGCCGEKSQIPQRYHDSKLHRDFPEQEMPEGGRSRDGIATLMKAADRSRFRGEE